MANRAWPPDHRIKANFGPYNRQMLEDARQTLIYCLLNDPGELLARAKPKAGLASKYGAGIVPPPIRIPASNIPTVSSSSSGSNRGPSDSGWSSMSEESEDRAFSTKSSDAAASHSRQPVLTHCIDLTEDDQVTSNKRKLDAYGGESSHGKSKLLKVEVPSNSTSTHNYTLNLAAPVNQDKAVGKLYLVYKCDFCLYRARDKRDMTTHLSSAKHFSGSLYSARDGPNGVELVFCEEMLSIKNEHGKTKALVVSCPDCRDLFEDIFMCGIHHKYEHGSVNGCYSVCPIIYHETVAFKRHPQCEKCREKFDKHKTLNNHWRSFPDHNPVTEPSATNVFMLHICPYCQKTFYNNMYECKSHILDAHNEHQHQMAMAMEVKHVLQPSRRDELVPFNVGSAHTNDGTMLEIGILTNMKNHFQKMNGKKEACKVVLERLRELKKLVNMSQGLMDLDGTGSG